MRRMHFLLGAIKRFGVAALLIGLLPPLVSGAYAKDAAGAVSFQWSSSPALILPRSDAAHDIYAVKDPTVVKAGGKFHVFMTTAGANGWHMATVSFTDWAKAKDAPVFYLDQSGIGPGYRAAPQVFYFAPQKLWYMIFQGGDPMYSTTKDIDDPKSWSAPKPFFASVPDVIRNGGGGWLDFWNICDQDVCYLFNTDDNGHLYRSRTALKDFPHGYDKTELVLSDTKDRLFEASMTYKIAGMNRYITMVEAMGADGRYFRIWQSDRLDGVWHPLNGPAENLFAGKVNVRFDGAPWAVGVSHGELLRQGNDQTMTLDACTPMQFLYQGLPPGNDGLAYIRLPYRLGLLTATEQPQLAECKTGTR